MSIGQRIKETRIQQGLSIGDLACRIGKNRTTIYRYENGDIENLPLGILDSLADALNTTPAYLMGWETPPKNTCAVSDDADSIEALYLAKQLTENGCDGLSEEECQKLMEYAKFLLSIREDK